MSSRHFPAWIWLLQKPEAEVEAIIEELKSRRLLRLSYRTDEDRGYELSADGKRYIRNQFQRSLRSM